MTAWIAYTDPLCVSIDQAPSGTNYPDNRSVWHSVSEVTLGAGGFPSSVWHSDSGPVGMTASLLEPRAFCQQGAATISFTGTTLIVRLNIAWSWFTGASVTIDGVAPSTLGLLSHTDTLSCDAASYNRTSDGYIDVVVADGLYDGPHVCIITINSTDASKVFSLAGYKVSGFSSQPLSRTNGYLVNASLPQNGVTIKVTNRGSSAVLNPTVAFPAGLTTSSGTALAPLTVASLAPTQSMTCTAYPAFTGNEVSGQFPYDLGLSALYVDPTGPIASSAVVTVAAGDSALKASGIWYKDSAAPGGLSRTFATDSTSSLKFTFGGDALTIVTQQASGWGMMGIFAADNTTLLKSIDCGFNGGSNVAPIALTGFGAGSHTVYLRKTVNDGAAIIFLSASWSVTQNFTSVSETVRLNYEAQQPIALPVVNAVAGTYDMTFDAPVVNAVDNTSTPARTNSNVAYTETLSRWPTFAVCYQPGFTSILSQYDILIVDPLAVHAADVIAWQAKGIKVFGYISSGEEVGTYTNRYDFSSALGPYQGAGPGGWATYYMYTKSPVMPDRDGVWAAYYINPDPAYGWPARLNNYYAPQVLQGPATIAYEVVTTKTVSIASGSVIVFDTAHSPIESDKPITLTTMDGTHTYTTYSDYTFDVKTGAFVLSTTVSPAITSGQQLYISYTRKGHHMDGVFFDTVDTPDDYGPAVANGLSAFGWPFVPGYADHFADLINNFYTDNDKPAIISNRGFTILPKIIKSCKGVMFESWLTLPTGTDLATTGYAAITDQPTIDYNDGCNRMMRELRLSHTFDVYSLNYASPGADGLALQKYCRQEDSKRGYLSWQSIINLNSPWKNTLVQTPGLPDVTSAFTRYKTKAV